MISKPMNVKREVHIELDEGSPYGLKVKNFNGKYFFNRVYLSNGKKP